MKKAAGLLMVATLSMTLLSYTNFVNSSLDLNLENLLSSTIAPPPTCEDLGTLNGKCTVFGWCRFEIPEAPLDCTVN